jgi:hypothetical protein
MHESDIRTHSFDHRSPMPHQQEDPPACFGRLGYIFPTPTASYLAHERRILKPSALRTSHFFTCNPDSRSVLDMNSTKTAHSSSHRQSPLRSIREKCIDCCAGNKAEVARCLIQSCTLWPFRMGRNPSRAGIGGKPGAGFSI